MVLDNHIKPWYHVNMIAPMCGHESKRVVKQMCDACYAKDYRERNPEIAKQCAKNYRVDHPDRQRAATNAWKEKNPDKVREHQRRANAKRNTGLANRDMWRYGITRADYENMYHTQGGVCAICSKPPIKTRLSVDHNHDTGQVRGLLCRPCNSVLGLAGDKIERLEAAIGYLRMAEG